MIIRVDLLNPSERRHMGPVRLPFLVRMGVFTVVALALIGLAIAIFNGLECRRMIERGEATWQDLEPRYKKVQALQARIRTLRDYLDELRDWQAAQQSVAWLDLLQDIVPENIQLTMLSFMDELVVTRPKTEGGTVELSRKSRMAIQGRAGGPQSETAVSDLTRRLRELAAPHRLFETVTLTRMQSVPSASERMNTFEINAVGVERRMKAQ